MVSLIALVLCLHRLCVCVSVLIVARLCVERASRVPSATGQFRDSRLSLGSFQRFAAKSGESMFGERRERSFDREL